MSNFQPRAITFESWEAALTFLVHNLNDAYDAVQISFTNSARWYRLTKTVDGGLYFASSHMTNTDEAQHDCDYMTVEEVSNIMAEAPIGSIWYVVTDQIG